MAAHRRAPAAPGPGYDARLAAATSPGPTGSGSSTRHWNATIRPAPPTTTSPSSPSSRAGKASGIGTALLRAHHATLDDAGMPAYLEAADLRTRQLYLRHGYVLQPNAPFHLPGGGPDMWPLWRHPRPHAAASIPSGGQRGSRR